MGGYEAAKRLRSLRSRQTVSNLCEHRVESYANLLTLPQKKALSRFFVLQPYAGALAFPRTYRALIEAGASCSSSATKEGAYEQAAQKVLS